MSVEGDTEGFKWVPYGSPVCIRQVGKDTWYLDDGQAVCTLALGQIEQLALQGSSLGLLAKDALKLRRFND